jgi:hypothetical protein
MDEPLMGDGFTFVWWKRRWVCRRAVGTVCRVFESGAFVDWPFSVFAVELTARSSAPGIRGLAMQKHRPKHMLNHQSVCLVV